MRRFRGGASPPRSGTSARTALCRAAREPHSRELRATPGVAHQIGAGGLHSNCVAVIERTTSGPLVVQIRDQARQHLQQDSAMAHAPKRRGQHHSTAGCCVTRQATVPFPAKRAAITSDCAAEAWRPDRSSFCASRLGVRDHPCSCLLRMAGYRVRRCVGRRRCDSPGRQFPGRHCQYDVHGRDRIVWAAA